MTRSTRLLAGLSLAALLVFATAATAFAAPVLSLSATRTTVTYPQPTWLKVAATDGGVPVPTAVTIQYRPVGTTQWKLFRAVSASRTAEGTVTVPVAPYRLKSITAFRAIANGLESATTTVSVKARLSAAVAPRVVRAGRWVTVRGTIAPRHAKGSRPVPVKVWKWEGGKWVLKATRHPKIVKQHADSSKWLYRVRAHGHDKGKWRIRVYHEDAKHVASVSRYTYVRVR